jgi:mono/diheme cytochrome c family protein
VKFARKIRTGVWLLIACGVAGAGCHTDMWVQPKSLPQQESDHFRDGSATRPTIPGTVAVGQSVQSDAFNTGRDGGGRLVRRIPFQVTKEHILRGQERFNIYCSPCHGMLGDGKGMIAQRGLSLRRQPANYHEQRLVDAPDGHFFHVMTHGFGVMFSYAYRVDVQDRWNIVAYIRALQLSQSQSAADLTPEQRQQLDKPQTSRANEAQGGASSH